MALQASGFTTPSLLSSQTRPHLVLTIASHSSLSVMAVYLAVTGGERLSRWSASECSAGSLNADASGATRAWLLQSVAVLLGKEEVGGREVGPRLLNELAWSARAHCEVRVSA